MRILQLGLGRDISDLQGSMKKNGDIIDAMFRMDPVTSIFILLPRYIKPKFLDGLAQALAMADKRDGFVIM
jgi:hypothetical protein